MVLHSAAGMGPMTAYNRITVNLSAEEYEALVAMSERFQVSLAWLGRRAISALIDQYDQGSGQLEIPFLMPPGK